MIFLRLVALTLALTITGASAEENPVVFLGEERIGWVAGATHEDPSSFSQTANDWPTGEAAKRQANEARIVWATFTLPRGDWRAPAVLLEGAAGDAELWIDGVQYPTPLASEVADLRILPLPRGDAGTRIVIRMVPQKFSSGLLGIALGNEATLNQQLLKQGIAPTIIGLVMMALSLVAFAVWTMTRRERFALRVFAFCLSTGALAFSMGPATAQFLSPHTLFSILYIGIGFFPWAILALSRDAFPEQAPGWSLWVERVLLFCGIVLWGAWQVAGSNKFVLSAPAIFFVSTTLSIFIVVRAVKAGNVDGRLLLGGLGTFYFFTIWDLLALLGFRTPTGFHVHWALLAMAASILTIFGRRLSFAGELLRQQTSALAAREREARATTERLLGNANELLSAVAKLRDSGTFQSMSIEKQAAALQETQVTAEEIRRTSALAAAKAESLLEQASAIDETQREGERAVVESLDGLASINAEVSAMTAAMGGIDALAQEIRTIVEVVKALADQSNMLALNAAIEAVRSGEHGKGFSVVAREVRRLADQSLQSTERIRQTLDRLADGVRDSTQASERGEKSVVVAVERLRSSGEQMKSMSVILRETNASVRQISAAVTQQNAGITQIFAAVAHLSEQMKEALERVQEAEQATLVVESVASRMTAPEAA